MDKSFTYDLRFEEKGDDGRPTGTVFMARESGALRWALQHQSKNKKISGKRKDIPEVKRLLDASKRSSRVVKYSRLIGPDSRERYKEIERQIDRVRSKNNDVHAFDAVNQFLHQFVQLIPMTDPAYLEAMFHRLCKMNVMRPSCSLKDLQALGNKGLMVCNCELWIHYCFCPHTFADGYAKNILKVPPTKDHRTTFKRGRKKTVGQPRHSKTGGGSGYGFV